MCISDTELSSILVMFPWGRRAVRLVSPFKRRVVFYDDRRFMVWQICKQKVAEIFTSKEDF